MEEAGQTRVAAQVSCAFIAAVVGAMEGEELGVASKLIHTHTVKSWPSSAGMSLEVLVGIVEEQALCALMEDLLAVALAGIAPALASVPVTTPTWATTASTGVTRGKAVTATEPATTTVAVTVTLATLDTTVNLSVTLLCTVAAMAAVMQLASASVTLAIMVQTAACCVVVKVSVWLIRVPVMAAVWASTAR